MRKFSLLAMGLALGFLTSGAQAETLRISGIYPAATDEAIEVEAIAVEPFGGLDGRRLSYLIEDRLRRITIEGDQWFTVVVPEQGHSLDGVLSGHVEPRFSESAFVGIRNVCWQKNAQDICIEWRDVETQCLRVNLTMQPEMRLAARNGRLLWASNASRATEVSFCPEFDAEPDFEPIIAGWLEEFAAHARGSLAPSAYTSSVRIMESRSGLTGDARAQFRAAIGLTESNGREACAIFNSLLASNPNQASLRFNTGLCAEQAGDLDTAEQLYSLALSSRRSDDEARAGLRRVAERLRARDQLELRARLTGRSNLLAGMASVTM